MSRSLYRFRVQGASLVTSLGMGGDAIRTALENGDDGLRAIDETGPGMFTYLAPDGFDKDLVPAGQRRRMSRLSRLAYAATSLALEDGRIQGEDLSGTALVFGTGLGEMQVTREFLETMAERGPLLASPALFQNSVHNAAASYIAMGLRMTGPAVTVSQGWISGEAALAAAATLLESGACRRALVVAAESFDPAWLRVIDPSPYRDRKGLVPFDPESRGVVWGESAAAMVLAPESEGSGVRVAVSLAAGPASAPEDTVMQAAADLTDGCPRTIPVVSGNRDRDAVLLRAMDRLFDGKLHLDLIQSRLGANPVMGLTLAALVISQGPFLILNLDLSGQAAALRIEPKEKDHA